MSFDAHFLLFLTAEGAVKGRIWWSHRRGWWVFCHVGWGRRFTKSQPPFQIQRRNVRSYYLDLVFSLSHTLHEHNYFLQWFRKEKYNSLCFNLHNVYFKKRDCKGEKFCNYTPIWLNFIGWLKFTYIYWRHLNWFRTWIHRLLNSCRTLKRQWKNIFIFCNAIMFFFNNQENDFMYRKKIIYADCVWTINFVPGEWWY